MNEAIRRIVIFLIRKRLGLKKGQPFRFTNQKEKRDYYVFTDKELVKAVYAINYGRRSDVSLNYILSDECEITTE